METENTNAREQERQTLDGVKRAFATWLGAELEKAAAAISGGGPLTCAVSKISPGTEHWKAAHKHHGWYAPVAGLELRLSEPGDTFARAHLLQIHLCREAGMPVEHHRGVPIGFPVQGLQLAMIPTYRQMLAYRHPGQSTAMGFLSSEATIGTMRGLPPDVQSIRVERVTESFSPEISQYKPFRASEWPVITEALRTAVTEAIDTFVDFVAASAPSIGFYITQLPKRQE